MPTAHADVIEPDLLAFVSGPASTARIMAGHFAVDPRRRTRPA
jgi:hypothetical protein